MFEKFNAHKVWTVALYDADQQYYYLKRFQLELSQKLQNILGENAGSKLIVISDKDYPRFEVRFGGHDSYREPLEIDAEEFIGVKSFKAKGKRIATYDVGQILELEPLRFNTTPDPEDNEEEEGGEGPGDDPQPVAPLDGAPAEAAEADDEEIDQQRLIDEITGQMTLF